MGRRVTAVDQEDQSICDMDSIERPARLISFEGIDGCGKSTLLARLTEWMEQAGIPHVKTREPGGTLLGEAVRSVLLDSAFIQMDGWTEALLYTASRAQHVKELIQPALRRGLWVLADRFVDATLAYQGFGRGLDQDRLRRMHQWSTGGLWPDCTVLLDCDVTTAFERRRMRDDPPDRLEGQERDFHERVRQGYLELAAAEPERFLVLDAARPLGAVTKDFEALFQKRWGLKDRRPCH